MRGFEDRSKKRDGTAIKIRILLLLAVNGQMAVYSRQVGRAPLASLLTTNPDTLRESLRELCDSGLVAEGFLELDCGPIRILRLTEEGARLIENPAAMQLLNRLGPAATVG